MYRACSTWQYEVVAHLLEHHRNGRRLGYLTAEQYAGPSRPDAAGAGPGAVPPTGSRVFKSHEGDRCFARAIADGRAVAVYAYRDVRDVVFSLMHKRGLTFEQLFRQGMIHQVLANDRFWTGRPDVLIQRYDEILADPVSAVRELAHHLGIEPAEGEAERIAHEYSLASNKARTEALRRRLEQERRRRQRGRERADLRLDDAPALEPRTGRRLGLLVRRVDAARSGSSSRGCAAAG